MIIVGIFTDYGYSLSGLTDNNMDGQNFDEQNSAINISDVSKYLWFVQLYVR